MLKFLPIDENVINLKKFFEQSETEFCDISVGVKYLWKDAFRCEYALFNDTLIIKESCINYTDAFYFPMGKDVEGALCEIENYCRTQNIKLIFCCIDDEHEKFLQNRYPLSETTDYREWDDYIYPAKQFISYEGKKLAGQRNHVNKFKREYPEYSFKKMTEKDVNGVLEFIGRIESVSRSDVWSEEQEKKGIADFIKKVFLLEQVGGILEVNGKIVGVSIGEKIKDTMIIHVEKADTSYNGAYPMLANEFAKAFCQDCTLINREEDCGDLGLRTSKLQYHPLTVKNKKVITINTGFDLIKNAEIKTERLLINDILIEDKKDYKEIYLSEELNRFWGYDYKEDLKGEPTEDYFFAFKEKLIADKEEYPLAIRLNGKMIGEITLWNFGYHNDVEIGFRIKKEYQKNGYATEAVKGMMSFLEGAGFDKIKFSVIEKNLSSLNLIKKLNPVLDKTENGKTFFHIDV